MEVTGCAALTDQIHEAALDPSLWTGVLSSLCTALHSHMGIIWGRDANGGLIGSIAEGPEALAIGMTSGAATTLATKHMQQQMSPHAEGAVVHITIPPTVSANDAKKYDGMHDEVLHSASAIVEKKADRSVTLTLFRQHNAGPYSKEELSCLQKLVPHLQTALGLHRRLHRLHALAHASTTALDTIPFGLLLLDHAGKLLHANARAQRLVEATQLLHLTEGLSVRCMRPADDVVLRKFVHSATQAGQNSNAGGAQRLTGNGGQLHVLIAPLPPRATPFGQRTAAVVFISDPAALPGSLLMRLRGVYSMTQAEARLTEALANGRTLQEYAEVQNVSMNTVRTQLKAAMAKVGVRRQPDLVRIVLTGPVVFDQAGTGTSG